MCILQSYLYLLFYNLQFTIERKSVFSSQGQETVKSVSARTARVIRGLIHVQDTKNKVQLSHADSAAKLYLVNGKL